MKNRTLTAVAAAVVASLPAAAAFGQVKQEKIETDTADLLEAARRGKRNELELMYESLVKAELDANAAWKIGSRSIDLPWAKMDLSGGWMVPLVPKPVDDVEEAKGRIPERQWIAAVYLGGGHFHWDPPNPTQEWLLNWDLQDITKDKKTQWKVLDLDVTEGVVIVVDGELRERFEQGREPAVADTKTFAAAKSLWTQRGDLYVRDYARRAVRTAFEGKKRNLLVLDVLSKGIRNAPGVLYELDSWQHEVASLSVVRRYALNKDSLDVWQPGKGVDPEWVKTLSDREISLRGTIRPIDVSHYTMDMTVGRDADLGDWGMDVEGSMDLSFVQPLRTLRFDFINDAGGASAEESDNPAIAPDLRPMSIRGITDGDGNRLTYLHKGHELVIVLPREYRPGENLQLKFKYSGNFIFTRRQPAPSGSLTDSEAAGAIVDIISWEVPVGAPWFPMNEFGDRFTFDWILRLPKPMVAATSGTLLSMTQEEKYNVHVIKEQTEEALPCIVFGRFSVTENDPDYSKGEYKIRLYTHPGFDKEAKSYLEEAQSIINYYEAAWGKYPFSELDMAQMAIGMGFAQAPAGIIRVTGEVYISKTDLMTLYNESDPQMRDYFIPHEIAHEWWGHKADFGGWSRDQWISESFAEFSAALYIEKREALKKNDPNWTRGYTDRKYFWTSMRRGGKTDRTAPLWAGDQMDQGQWLNTVYARGPLALDYIRKKYGRDRLIKAMYTFVELAARQNNMALTEDWKTVLEKVIPEGNWEEYFANFIRGNAEIPDVKGNVTVDEQPATPVSN